MPKPAHGRWETGNGNGKTGQAGATQPLHPACTCQSSVRSSSSFFLFFSFSFSCVCPFTTHPLTARPGFPAYIHTGEVQSHVHVHIHAKDADRMYMCRVCVVYVYVYVSDMFVRGPLGQECSTRGSRKGSSALLRSPGSPTYSAVRERERERVRNVFFSPGRKPCYAGSLPLTGIRSLVRSDDYMSGAVGACTHTIGAVQGLRAHPYPYP